MMREQADLRKLPRWQQKIIEHKAKKAIMKQSKEFYKKSTPLMDQLVSIMRTATDEEAQHLAVYLCTEIIAGFEEKDERMFILDSLTKTLELMNKEEY